MTNRLKAKILTVAVSILFGCATTTNAEREQQQLFADIKKVASVAQGCYNGLAGNEKYTALYANFALKRKPATGQELSNQAHVSDEMIGRILDWYAAHQKCDNAMVYGYQKLDGQLAVVSLKWLRDRAALLKRIIDDRPTYGRVNAELDTLKLRESKELQDWLSRTQQGFAARHRSELAEQERISQQRQKAVLSTVADVANAIVEGMVALATIQLALAASQRTYVVNQPTSTHIEPVQPRIRSTDCTRNIVTGGISCTHW
jgi:hypothetical protein